MVEYAEGFGRVGSIAQKLGHKEQGFVISYLGRRVHQHRRYSRLAEWKEKHLYMSDLPTHVLVGSRRSWSSHVVIVAVITWHLRFYHDVSTVSLAA